MGHKVGNSFTISTGEDNRYKGLHTPKNDGGVASQGVKDGDGGSKKMAGALKDAVGMKIQERGEHPQTGQKRIDTTSTPADSGVKIGKESEKQRTNYQEVRAKAGELSHLAKGTVQKPSESGLAGAGHRDGNMPQAQANNPLQNPKITQNTVQQNQVAMAGTAPGANATEGGAKKGPVLDQPARLNEAPKDGAKTVSKDAVLQAKGADTAQVGNQPQPQAGQAGVLASGQGAEKIRQQKTDTADNDGVKKDEKEEKADTAASPWMQASNANKKLDGLLGGFGGGKGSENGENNLELVANRIDSGDEDEARMAEKERRLGLEVFSEYSAGDLKVKYAATEFKKDVVQILESYVPIDEKIGNWKPADLLSRVLTDTKADIEAAKELITAMRTRGKHSPNGYGMPA